MLIKISNFSWKGLFWLIMTFAVLAGHCQAANQQTIESRYNAAYKAYQMALKSGAPDAQTQAVLKEYLDAKKLYEQSTGLTDDPYQSNQSPSSSEISQTAQAVQSIQCTDPIQSSGNSNQQSSYKGSSATSKSSSENIPPELQALLADLWSQNSRKNPEPALQKLENYVSRQNIGPVKDQAIYELVKAYEILKNDKKKAASWCNQISSTPANGKYQTLANLRLKYYAASEQCEQWKYTLNSRYLSMQASFADFSKTSWLLFPVKITRYFSYLGKMKDFQNAKDDYEKYQIYYDEVAAYFSLPPAYVFDKFKPVTADGEIGTNVRLIESNVDAWLTRWKLLSEAKKSITIQYFMVEKDIFGLSLTGLLQKKAREGVKIKFMIDARGSQNLAYPYFGQQFLQELSKYPNVEVKIFNPIKSDVLTVFIDLKKIVASNHDKIFVVDGEYVINGGRNISKDWYLDPLDLPTAYRDYDVLIKNTEIAEELSNAFDDEFQEIKAEEPDNSFFEDWTEVSKELDAAYNTMNSFVQTGSFFNSSDPDSNIASLLKSYNAELAGYKHFLNLQNYDLFCNSIPCKIKIIEKNSLSGPRNDITDQLVNFIDGARKEIIIQSPYVVLTQRAENALKRAAARKIPIILHTNSPISSDEMLPQAMFYRDWKEILKDIPTLRIFVFPGERRLHGKAFVFDGTVGIVGTYNMDYLSEDVNAEIVSCIKSADFTSKLRADIIADTSVSKEYSIKIAPDGTPQEVFGPDDLKSNNFWMIKLFSNMGWLKPIL
ncbi:MAG: phosphatidylserine/phosphatidylglycerophosphate/cardiolipin synthase family protein [Candidatus Riflebacteria bacterium]|nr:phosphatidylserine/phosphatidylglycerophosphate/cardiolipin synthase family protein [Candidatus Riflebacteria bacterium]